MAKYNFEVLGKEIIPVYNGRTTNGVPILMGYATKYKILANKETIEDLLKKKIFLYKNEKYYLSDRIEHNKNNKYIGYLIPVDFKKEIEVEEETKMENLEEIKKKYEELGQEIKRLEELKNKRWRGKIDENYYLIYSDGKVRLGIEENHIMDDYRYKTRNYFKTEKEAEEVLERIKIYNELKDLAEELNTEDINWNDSDQIKYFILYDFNDNN